MSREKTIIKIAISIAAPCILASCNVLKNVPPDDKLYQGAKISYADSKVDKEIKKNLKKIIQPKSNASMLGIKYRLILFNMLKEPVKKKGLGYTMKHNWGEPPVLLSQARPTQTAKKLEDKLFSEGWLRPNVRGQINMEERTASVAYTVETGSRYKIRNVFWSSDSSALSHLIRESSQKTLLKKNKFLQLELLKNERDRIDQYLKQYGYFYFSPDHILFKTDSMHHDTADLYVTLKEDIAAEAKRPWKISDIIIFGNYTLERDSLLLTQNPEKYGDYLIVDPRKTFRYGLYDRVVVMGKGKLYRRRQHSLTIERLMNLGSIKFAKINFEPDADSTKLNTKIYITPAKKRSVRLELSGYTKSNNFVGSELSLSYRNINLFRGAEILEGKVNFGFDAQVGGQQVSSNAYSLTGEINLYIPKMLVPFKMRAVQGSYLPRTIFTSRIEFVRRPELYTLRSVSFAAGYYWKKGRSTEHILRVLNINSVEPRNITAEFDSILAQDVTLKASFEKQLVIGTRYEYKFNNTYRVKKKFNYAFDGYISTSGNLASLFFNPTVDTPGAKQLFSIPISQYIRLQADARAYYRLSSSLIWVNRIIAGAAFAYGNSAVVPYAEQFFIGGSSSVRAFRARTLGPGSFYSPEKVYLANESGEIKVEMNSELRMSLNKFIKFATFMDAGNIWLRNDAIDKPGSGLSKGDLFREMAVGAGLGIRLDASFLLVRFDLTFPLRKPWYPEGKRWVFNEIDFGSSTWRKDNIVLNIGIGYPF